MTFDDLVEAHATVQSKKVMSFERTRSNRVNMQDVLTPKVFISYKTDLDPQRGHAYYGVNHGNEFPNDP